MRLHSGLWNHPIVIKGICLGYKTLFQINRKMRKLKGGTEQKDRWLKFINNIRFRIFGLIFWVFKSLWFLLHWPC